MKSKKAQGLPLNTIILALLGLAVMVLIIAAMTGRLGGFIKATAECPGRCTPHDTPPSRDFDRDACHPTMEAEQTGNYIQRGTKGSQVPKECEKCCLRLY